MQSEHYSFVDGAISGPNLLLETEAQQKVLILDLAKVVQHLLCNLHFAENEIIEIIMKAFGVTRDAAKHILDSCLLIIMTSMNMRVVDIEREEDLVKDPFMLANNDNDPGPGND